MLSARARGSISLATGLVTGALLGTLVSVRIGILGGWSLTSATFVLSLWRVAWPADAKRTAQLARQEQQGRQVMDLLLTGGALLSLAGVGFAVYGSNTETTGIRLVTVLLGVFTAIVSWTLVNSIYALKYARLFHAGDGNGSGLDFQDDDRPTYREFAYLAFTVGMTYGVTDTDIKSPAIRREVLRHALLSYAFGTGIIAAAIGLIQSLGQ